MLLVKRLSIKMERQKNQISRQNLQLKVGILHFKYAEHMVKKSAAPVYTLANDLEMRREIHEVVWVQHYTNLLVVQKSNGSVRICGGQQ